MKAHNENHQEYWTVKNPEWKSNSLDSDQTNSHPGWTKLTIINPTPTKAPQYFEFEESSNMEDQIHGGGGEVKIEGTRFENVEVDYVVDMDIQAEYEIKTMNG